jgi:hypothetical protein
MKAGIIASGPESSQKVFIMLRAGWDMESLREQQVVGGERFCKNALPHTPCPKISTYCGQIGRCITNSEAD